MSRSMYISYMSVIAAAIWLVVGCDTRTSGQSGVFSPNAIPCHTPEDCLAETLRNGGGSEEKASDFICLKPTPDAPEGRCNSKSNVFACPASGCGCNACVHRVDLLCNNCGTVSACLPTSYCDGLEAGDCDPPTLSKEACSHSEDASIVD